MTVTVRRSKTDTKGITLLEWVRDSDGKVVKRRYRLVVDAGRDGGTGRRRQLTSTHTTLKAARAEQARVLTDRTKGSIVLPDRSLTVERACRQWLAGQRDLEPSSRRTYAMEMRQVNAAVGQVKAQALTKSHVEELVNGMLSGASRRSGRKGTPLSAATVKAVVGRLASVLDALVAEGVLVRNVTAGVKLPAQPARPDEKGWDLDRARTFLASVKGDRHRALYWLALCGLRRHEVLQLRWQDIDVDAGKLRVVKSKTASGVREVPLFPQLAQVLAAHRDMLAAEASMAGEAYQPGDLVAVDDLGQPVNAEWWSSEWLRTVKALDAHVRTGDADEWLRNVLRDPDEEGDTAEVREQRARDLDDRVAQVKAAGYPRCTLHSARHTAGSVLYTLTGDPWAVQSWLGHSRASFSLKAYVDSPRWSSMQAAAARFGAVLGADV